MDKLLNSQLLELVDISHCETYAAEKYTEDSDDNRDIREAASKINDEPEKVTWVCGQTLDK